MLIYYFLFSVVILLGIAYKAYDVDVETNNRAISFGLNTLRFNLSYLTLIGLFLTIIIGLRDSSVGIDVKQYQYLYDNSLYFYTVGYNKTEFGFYALVYFFHNILGLSFQFFVFFVAALCIFSIGKTLKRFSSNHLVSIIIYLTLGTFTMNMSGLRQSIAISLILFAVHCAYDKKIIWFYALVAIAYTFHNSALVFIPAYFLFNHRITKKTAIILNIVAVMAFVYRGFLIPVFQFFSPERYGRYIEYVHNAHINPLVMAVPLIFVVFELLFVPLEEDDKYSSTNSFAFIFVSIAIFMRILSLNEPSIGRLGYYFCIGDLILVPRALVGVERSSGKKGAHIIAAIIVLLCCLYFLISTPGDTLHIDEFRFFWQK